MKDAILYLEDGKCFRGTSLNTYGETAGECVFNTALSGYQEVLTDPSYAGQIVVMTYPLIGNYGVNEEDTESDKVHVKGFVVKEFCRTHSNYRATKSLIQYLDENKIVAIEGVDTRALTRHLRLSGAMKGIISTADFDFASLKAKLAQVPSMDGADWVKEVAPQKPYIWQAVGDKKYKVVVIDCGIKRNILREMALLGIECHVVPPTMSAADILALKPEGIFLSSGPGDPAAVTYVIATVRELIGKVPIFGICLGNQMIGLALGGKTYKLKFGHHGTNQPVKDLENDRISITSQNHGFCVDIDSLNKNEVEAVHINLNDKSVEGLRHRKYPLFSIQYHPEACPGPNDAKYLFGEFVTMIEKFKK
ncbi:MAG: glutamine-hydrolyzing carbamoyl-phosphate synthase small subunit [Candidatus Omnitrophica bacterium]|nr:glutamine-hydrolyzing carbamoyl-phosphate synthase small subunit [Candidatus Omnitrophota bacterium]